MTLATSYSTLQTRIAEILDRNDLVDQIPSFIQMAEDDLGADVDHPRNIDTIVIQADPIVGVPIDFQRVVSMTQIGVGEVYYYPMAEFDDLCTAGSGGRLYTIIGENFHFAPWLDGSNTRLVYQRRLDALADFNPTNWILSTYPSAYVYGALKHAALYLIEDERLPVWEKMYGDIVARINKDAVMHTTPQTTRMIKKKVV